MGINDHITKKSGKSKGPLRNGERSLVQGRSSNLLTLPSGQISNPDQATLPSRAYAEENTGATLDFLYAATLGLDEDGYLRIIPAYPTRWHVYWTWRSGKWKDHYVYWAAEWNRLSEGLHGILTKIEWVNAGQLRPTLVSKNYRH